MMSRRFPVAFLVTGCCPLVAVPSALAQGNAPRARGLGLGAWKRGPVTEIDCTLAKYDFDYLIDRCWDDTTQWFANGSCLGGTKTEVSELHKCMLPDGCLKYCHDCDDGRGNIKHVCGSESPSRDVACAAAWEGTAEGCGDEYQNSYSHQCIASDDGGPSTESWFMREELWCPENYVKTDRKSAACGEEWYYESSPGDFDAAAVYPEFEGVKHPFATPTNKYCLDCGIAIAVCAGEASATCASLGLPQRGMPFEATTAPYVSPPAYWTHPAVDGPGGELGTTPAAPSAASSDLSRLATVVAWLVGWAFSL